MATTSTPAANKRLVRRFPEEVATEANYDLIDEICTADVVDRSPLGEVRGRDALKAHIESINTAFSDHSAAVEELVAEGETVAMRVTLSGRHTGEFMGFAPTDRTFEVSNAVLTRLEDGRIAERRVHPDVFGILRQLGLVDLPEP